MIQVTKKADMAQRAVRENEALRAENAKLKARLDYIAMMTDVEIDEEETNHDDEV